MKEFKVGDKCYIECTVTEIKNGLFDYPIVVEFANKERFTFTINGKYYTRDNMQTLKHIEDIIPNPEFPKWMMVSHNNCNWHKRFVLCKALHKSISLECAKSEKDKEYVEYLNGDYSKLELTAWKYAKEIEPENTKLQELEIKYKELGEEIEKLKKWK